MMRRITDFATLLRREESGAMLVEAAIVAPVLVLLSMGAFQISEVIARQTELQAAVAEASAIALAAPPETSAQRTVLKSILVDSSGLAAEKVSVSQKFRCGSATTYVNAASDCVDTKVANYVLIELNDTYTPVWTQWGFGGPIDYNIDRYVMVKQS